jgi:hypothetical protein
VNVGVTKYVGDGVGIGVPVGTGVPVGFGVGIGLIVGVGVGDTAGPSPPSNANFTVKILVELKLAISKQLVPADTLKADVVL